MNRIFILAIMLSVGALASACSPDRSALNLPPGKYEKDVISTDENGVKTEQKDSTKVNVDSSGHKTATVESKTTEQPPGLLGVFKKKTTNESTRVLEEDNSSQ
ncbi:MAG: hypothetical protein KGL39_29085 [Patescibacteria group bacterium]|nr:hypothetical protein [Patescibacteria group bacterium]